MKISSEAQPSGTATGRSQGELGERLLSSPRCKVVTVSLSSGSNRFSARFGLWMMCYTKCGYSDDSSLEVPRE